jgi:hypothetical protein
MAGLVPAIHVELHTLYNVDARDRPGHDGGECCGPQLPPVAMVPAFAK